MADDLILDDPTGLEAADDRGLLRSAADAGAQVRRALDPALAPALDRVAADGRPRALVVLAGGAADGTAEALDALLSPRSPVPVHVRDDDRLPGWAGALDLVVVLDGPYPAVAAAAAEAARRGCRLVTVARPRSSLSDLATQAGAPALELPAPTATPPGAAAAGLRRAPGYWGGIVATLRVAVAADLADGEGLDGLADALDEIALACGTGVPLGESPAKGLGLSLAESLPGLWATTPLAGAAAARMAERLAHAAAIPAAVVPVGRPGAERAAALMAGPAAAATDLDDLFRDRVEEPEADVRLRLVLLRDTDDAEDRAGTGLAVVRPVVDIAEARGVPVSELRAESGDALLRLAALVGTGDWAVAYAALSGGRDPDALARQVRARLASG
ncbi:MAG: SIS domain-containing protein [Candidatus Nanopelagicales bacterium]